MNLMTNQGDKNSTDPLFCNLPDRLFDFPPDHTEINFAQQCTIKLHGAACPQVREKHRCFWGKKAASTSSGARSANKWWLWVTSAAGSRSWMNSSLSHYRQFPLLGKHLFPGTSAFSALEKLSYQIQISACLNSHPGSGLKGCVFPRYRRTNEPNGSCSLNKFKKY